MNIHRLILLILVAALLPACSSGSSTPAVDNNPTTFTLLGPGDGFRAVSLDPVLTWTDSTLETEYIVQVDDNSGFTSPLIFETTVPADTTKYSVPAGTLTANTTYWWRIIAQNGSGQTTAANAAFSFVPFAWAQTFGGVPHDVPYDVQQTSDGGFIVAGNTLSFGTALELWVIKLDADGAIQWENSYGGTTNDEARSIRQTADGGYIVAGATDSFGAAARDFWLLKLNNDGTVNWQKRYGGAASDTAEVVLQTSDNGYFLTGRTDSFGTPTNVWALKLAADGTIQWQKYYGATGNDWAADAIQTLDGGFVIVGSTTSFGAGSEDIWVLRLASDGSIVWQYAFGGADFDEANGVVATFDGKIAITGQLNSEGPGPTNLGIIVLEPDGTVAWQKAYGLAAKVYAASSIDTTRDGDLIVGGVWVGPASLDILTMKLDSAGILQWDRTVSGGSTDMGLGIRGTSGGGAVMVAEGQTFGAGGKDWWVLKMNTDGTIPAPVTGPAELTLSTSAQAVDTTLTVTTTNVSGIDTAINPFNTSATVATTTATVNVQAP